MLYALKNEKLISSSNRKIKRDVLVTKEIFHSLNKFHLIDRSRSLFNLGENLGVNIDCKSVHNNKMAYRKN